MYRRTYSYDVCVCMCVCAFVYIIRLCVCAGIVYSGYLETSAASVAVLSVRFREK